MLSMRLLGLDHRDHQHFVVGDLLVVAGLAVHRGADRAVAALALRRIQAIGDQCLGFGLGVHHRADHAPGAAVQHLADDARLIPRHAHQRRDRVRLHRLEALHHGLVVLHAVLHVHGHAVPAALRHHLGGEAGGNGEPAVDAGLAGREARLEFVGHLGVSPSQKESGTLGARGLQRQRGRSRRQPCSAIRPWFAGASPGAAAMHNTSWRARGSGLRPAIHGFLCGTLPSRGWCAFSHHDEGNHPVARTRNRLFSRMAKGSTEPEGKDRGGRKNPGLHIRIPSVAHPNRQLIARPDLAGLRDVSEPLAVHLTPGSEGAAQAGWGEPFRTTLPYGPRCRAIF